MSTRAIAKFHDEWNDKVVATIYKHWDGYPDGFGDMLRNLVSEYTIVNGISLNDKRKIANGMGCLAAAIVAEIKAGPGGVYLCSPDSREEYNYHVRLSGDKATVTCDEEPGW